jgi:Na+/proline symporter
MYDFQLFLATRNPRDASKVGAAWSFFLIVRWAMTAGITLLALSGITHAADPEQVMPIVLRNFLPAGLRGIVIAGLLAAFMSTFSATVNSAASFVVRDLYQPFFKQYATERQLVMYGRIATVAVVILGIAIGFRARSIAQIWNWIMMALGAGVIMPNALRWYWWRMTGWGYAAGTLGGIALSLVALLAPDAPMYVIFPPICLGSLIASITGSLVTRPVDEYILVAFYRNVRPFGVWQPILRKAGLTDQENVIKSERASIAILNTCMGMVAISGYYLFPMYLVGHWHFYSLLCLGAAFIATAILAVTWYPNLTPDMQGKDTAQGNIS